MEETEKRTFGYMRISSVQQNLDLQRDALEKAGCDQIFEDNVSSKYLARPGLDSLLSHARKGDTILVYKLDRIGRNFDHLRELITGFKKKGIIFKSLTEGFDLSTDAGMLIFNLMGAFAEYERNLINERIRDGIAAARARGRSGGRNRSLTPRQITELKKLAANREIPISYICEKFKISRTTYYSYLNEDPKGDES